MTACSPKPAYGVLIRMPEDTEIKAQATKRSVVELLTVKFNTEYPILVSHPGHFLDIVKRIVTPTN